MESFGRVRRRGRTGHGGAGKKGGRRLGRGGPTVKVAIVPCRRPGFRAGAERPVRRAAALPHRPAILLISRKVQPRKGLAPQL